jgi:acyl dehydratase
VGLAFEDFEPGQAFELGEASLTAEDIVRFAREFDPQPFHLDEDAARATHFGGLIASGWHTSALLGRMLVTGLLTGSTGMGSPGVDEVRFLAPVRPGDRLRGRATVLSATPSSRRPERGTVRLRLELLLPDEQPVLTLVAAVLFGRRATAASSA